MGGIRSLLAAVWLLVLSSICSSPTLGYTNLPNKLAVSSQARDCLDYAQELNLGAVVVEILERHGIQTEELLKEQRQVIWQEIEAILPKKELNFSITIIADTIYIFRPELVHRYSSGATATDNLHNDYFESHRNKSGTILLEEELPLAGKIRTVQIAKHVPCIFDWIDDGQGLFRTSQQERARFINEILRFNLQQATGDIMRYYSLLQDRLKILEKMLSAASWHNLCAGSSVRNFLSIEEESNKLSNSDILRHIYESTVSNYNPKPQSSIEAYAEYHGLTSSEAQSAVDKRSSLIFAAYLIDRNKKDLDIDKDLPALAAALENLNILAEDETLLGINGGYHYRMGGAETYIASLDLSLLRASGGKENRRFIAKVVATPCPETHLAGWLRSIAIFKKLGLRVPENYHIDKKNFILYQEYIPFEADEIIDELSAQERIPYLRQLAQFAAGLDAAGYTSSSENCLRDFRIDKNNFLCWFDFGEDIGGANIGRPTDRNKEKALKHFCVSPDERDIFGSAYDQARTAMQPAIEELEKEKLREFLSNSDSIATIMLKGGENGGLNQSVLREILRELSKDFIIVLGRTNFLTREKALQRWGNAFRAIIKSSLAEFAGVIPEQFAQIGISAVESHDAVKFDAWLDQLGTIEETKDLYLKLKFVLDYGNDSCQQIILIRKSPRQEILARYNVNPELARNLLDGEDPLEIPEQNFVKNIIIGSLKKNHPHCLRNRIINPQLEEGGAFYDLVLFMKDSGLKPAQTKMTANAIHVPATDEMSIELQEMFPGDIRYFIQAILEFINGQKAKIAENNLADIRELIELLDTAI